MSYRPFRLAPGEKQRLRSQLLHQPEIVPFVRDPKYFSLVAALGIHQEIGTVHDEFSKFLFDEMTLERVPRERMRSEFVEYQGFVGVRIWAEGVERLDPRVRGMRTLLHPEFSYRDSKRIHQCVFFPEIITKIAARESAELVSVRPWGINTVFGGFDPRKTYYEGNMFEFINLDAIRYSRLLEKRQIVFWGTHDLVSHIAGIRKSAWPELEQRGADARRLFEDYFREVAHPKPVALVLPYALGMLLDDLTQPMNYGSRSRRHIVDLLTQAIRSRVISPRDNSFLLKYPPAVETLIELARRDDFDNSRARGAQVLSRVVHELRTHAVTTPGASTIL